MGLFNLGDYKRRKERADESATAPRAFPVVFADVMFDGRKQKLWFEPVLFDGGHVFISFRPENHGPEFNLIAGGGDTPHSSLSAPAPVRTGVPEALLVSSGDAFKSKKWLARAVQAIENGHFGRLRVEETAGRLSFVYFHFYGSTGAVVTEDYSSYLDGARGGFFSRKKANYDPEPDYGFWAKHEDAAALLTRLDENEFALHLECEKADSNSVLGISSRWDELSFNEKYALLPELEKDIERELLPLMRAIVWSEPSLGRGEALRPARELGVPFWRRPRFWVKPDTDQGETFHFDKRFEKRIVKIWPHIVARFLPRFETLERTEVHPAVLHWMEYRGAYLVEFDTPNAHEHLEARLLLRDFLYQKGVSLDKLERE